MNTENVVFEEETSKKQGPSNNELFKMRMGYSRTMHNLMKKYKCVSPEEYRIIRKKNRKNRKS